MAFSNKGRDYLLHGFYVKPLSEEWILHEHTTWLWATKEEILALPLSDSDRDLARLFALIVLIHIVSDEKGYLPVILDGSFLSLFGTDDAQGILFINEYLFRLPVFQFPVVQVGSDVFQKSLMGRKGRIARSTPRLKVCPRKGYLRGERGVHQFGESPP